MSVYAGYVGAKTCTGTPQPGARGLMAWFLAKYADDGGVNSGIYNCRDIRGGTTTSLHGEGRAVDLGIRPYSAAYGDELADLLRRYSKELGIQCIIWNRKIWSGYYKTWQTYTGVNRHVDHIHVELSWASAKLDTQDMVDLLEGVLGDLVDGLAAEPVPAGTPTVKPSKPKTVRQNSGNSKADNVRIAKLLNALGYEAGVPDGVAGPYLRDGVKDYQESQEYFPGMKPDGDWAKMTQAHYVWVRDVLQPAVSRWEASQRLGTLPHDGDYRAKTKRHVAAIMRDNWKRYYALGGRVADGEAGPIFCKLLGIKPHPSA